MPVKVLTDHKGLEYFMTTKKLTPRQARWAEFLSEFNFIVTYQSGKKNDKADALTRKPNEQPANEDDKRQKHRMQVLLPPERIHLQPDEVEHDDHEKATRNKSVEVDHDNPKAEAEELKRLPPTEFHTELKEETKKAEKLGGSHAAELHIKPDAEPEEETDETLPD